tara:strand:- start:470 stop:832 length:363 start_codon:yes stop_codon:yes gene_type:complete
MKTEGMKARNTITGLWFDGSGFNGKNEGEAKVLTSPQVAVVRFTWSNVEFVTPSESPLFMLCYGIKTDDAKSSEIYVESEVHAISSVCGARLANLEREGRRIVWATVLDSATGAVVTKLR